MQHLREHVPALASTHFIRQYFQSFAEDPITTDFLRGGNGYFHSDDDKKVKVYLGIVITPYPFHQHDEVSLSNKGHIHYPESRIKGCDNWHWKDDANVVALAHHHLF